MNKQLYLITLIIAFVLIQACKRDDSSGCGSYSTNYHTLSTGAINQTPYFTDPAFDTISFASDKGDTVTFVKTKTDTTWYCENDNSNADCPREKANCYQVLHNNYTTIKGKGTFDVRLNSRTNSGSINRLDITFNDRTFWIGNDAIGVKNTNGFLGDSYINGKTYKNVSKASSSYFNIFLNNNYGLFKIEYFIDKINWINFGK